MAQPTQSAVHVDAPLTNISVAFLQNANNFIAGRVFPNVPVTKQSDRYYTYDRGFFNRDEAQKRAPGTETAGAGFELDNTPTYYADPYGIHHDVADQIRANADPSVDLERAAAELLMHKMLIRKEVDWTSKYFAASIWGTDVTGVASSVGTGETLQWNDDSSTPIEDIRSAITTVEESTGYTPNTFAIGKAVFDALVDHPDIVDRIKYSGGVGNDNPAVVTERSLAQVFGVERVMVSRAIKNTAAEGAANSHSFISGKKALLTYAAPTPGLMVPSGGYTFSWNGYLGQTNAFGIATSRFRMNALRADRIEAEMAFDHKLVAADLGYFWDSIVA